VNPKRGNDEDARRLAGVGVAFKLCHALVKAGRAVDDTGASEMDLRGYLDWVALGTICDMVPLQGENRVLARHGLGAVEARRTAGLRALMEVANVRGEVTGYHLGFLLGPRLNASGRLGDAQVALDLLLTANEAEAGEWAQALDVANRERQRLEKETVTEAREMIDETFDAGRDYGLVSAAEGWHPGVVGIVASRLTRHYRRPNVVIAMSEEGCGKGSCRSIDQLNLVEALQACDDLLEKWGGHAMAAGLEVRKEYVEAFRERFNNVCRKRLADEDLRPMEQIDAWVDLGHLDRAFYDAQQLLRPFGMENPQPVWAARNVRVIGKPRVMAEKHIRMTVTAGGREIDAVGFGMADREIPDGPLDIAFRLKLNVFRGRENLELHLRDFRASE
jgi:single-stranded-DNA-specific exonuclease